MQNGWPEVKTSQVVEKRADPGARDPVLEEQHQRQHVSVGMPNEAPGVARAPSFGVWGSRLQAGIETAIHAFLGRRLS